MEVKTFDSNKLKKAMKKADPMLVEYITALKRALEGQEQVTNEAMKKIRQLTGMLNPR